MKFVAFVPLKKNSQRLKNKNFRILGNKPLFLHVVDRLVLLDKIDALYVYTNADLKDYSLPSKVNVLSRPLYLDEDEALGVDIYREFVNSVESDFYILCHATSPFVELDSINKGIDAILNYSYDSSFSVREFKSFAWYNGRPLNFELNSVPRTQDIQPVYLETSAFYIFSREMLLNHGKRIGDKPFLVKVGRIEGLDIDYEDDFIEAKSYLKLIEKDTAR
jgi:CMP-N-acetylneuraminic acid synthetase